MKMISIREVKMHARTVTAVLVAVFLSAAAGGCGRDLLKADELLGTGDFDGAAAIYQKRLDKDPSDAAGLIGLSRTLCMAAIEHAKAGKDTAEEWNKAVELMGKAAAIDPAPEGVQAIGQEMYGDCLARAGAKRFEAGDAKGAIEALEKAADGGLKTADLFMTLARAYFATGEGQEAMKAANKAAKIDAGNEKFLREVAGWATKFEQPWLHHYFFYRAEQIKPMGLKFKKPTEITKGLATRYGALNLVNDTLGLFLFTGEAGPDAWTGVTERESIIADMEKFMGKKPPASFKAEDKPRLTWLVYHYWNTTGVVFVYLGDKERARKWFDKAAAIDPARIKHPNLSEDQLKDEASWAKFNLGLL
jgi:tetratricopeptide (TPR) repeat protein